MIRSLSASKNLILHLAFHIYLMADIMQVTSSMQIILNKYVWTRNEI